MHGTFQCDKSCGQQTGNDQTYPLNMQNIDFKNFRRKFDLNIYCCNQTIVSASVIRPS